MRKRFLFFPLIFIAFFLLGGLAVMLLWNAILPQVLSAQTVNYWQALGLLVLARILFGGGGMKRPGGGGWQHKSREKWMNMTDEDRMRIKEEWKRRCGK